MRLGIAASVHSLSWIEARNGAHVVRAALAFLMNQVENGVCCPIAMTHAAVPVLRHEPRIAAEWEPRLLSADYDPRFLPGPDNPGRSPVLFLQQVANYLQYFDWQWAAGIMRGVPAGLTPRLVFTMLYIVLGVTGLGALRRRDRSAFALLVTLWLVTGLGLVVYMNFRPGFSLFWAQYRTMDEHEVRERDYFFTVSFQAWALFAGIGIVEVARRAVGTWGRGVAGVFGLAVVPLVLNFTAASRRHGPEATLARDWAYNLLQSVEPYGVLFTYGDNDTYPLWYAQEVEGVRTDVRMVNLSLANTDWHLRFVRDRAPGPYDSTRAPAIYPAIPERPEGPLFELDDSTIAGLRAMRVDGDVGINAGGAPIRIRDGTVLYPRDQAVLFVVEEVIGSWNASVLGSMPRSLDGVQLGTIELTITIPEFMGGIDKRFGVIYVDYATQERTIKRSGGRNAATGPGHVEDSVAGRLDRFASPLHSPSRIVARREAINALRSAISRLDRPSASRPAISYSRLVSWTA